MIFRFSVGNGLQLLSNLTAYICGIDFSHNWIPTKSKNNKNNNETNTHRVLFQAYLGGEVLLGWEGLSESTESMLDQVIQLTWVRGRGRRKWALMF